LAKNYYASAATWQQTLRSQFGKNYDAKKIRNTSKDPLPRKMRKAFPLMIGSSERAAAGKKLPDSNFFPTAKGT
jgi:hypothetical protein